MQIRTIYRWVLALPLVVPCLLLPLGLFHIAPPMLERFISLAGLAAVVGGIPYALLALGLLWWMRGKSEPQIRMAMFIAPLLMVALLGVVIVCVVVMEGSPLDADVFTAWLAYSGYALGFGYFYVAVASVIVWLARRIGAVGGIVRDERAPDAPEAEP